MKFVADGMQGRNINHRNSQSLRSDMEIRERFLMTGIHFSQYNVFRGMFAQVPCA